MPCILLFIFSLLAGYLGRPAPSVSGLILVAVLVGCCSAARWEERRDARRTRELGGSDGVRKAELEEGMELGGEPDVKVRLERKVVY